MIANAPAGASISPVMHYLQTRGLLQHRNLLYCPPRLVYVPHSPSPSREIKRRSLPSFRSLACVVQSARFFPAPRLQRHPAARGYFQPVCPLLAFCRLLRISIGFAPPRLARRSRLGTSSWGFVRAQWPSTRPHAQGPWDDLQYEHRGSSRPAGVTQKGCLHLR